MSQENQNIQEEPHKRRVRYKGKYPRNYKEKYKELNPEKYQDTIEKVIRKGSTPAGRNIRLWRTHKSDAGMLKRAGTYVCDRC